MMLVLEISTIASMSPANAQDGIQGNKHRLSFRIRIASHSAGACWLNDGRGGLAGPSGTHLLLCIDSGLTCYCRSLKTRAAIFLGVILASTVSI